jgi:hypothetical protein
MTLAPLSPWVFAWGTKGWESGVGGQALWNQAPGACSSLVGWRSSAGCVRARWQDPCGGLGPARGSALGIAPGATTPQHWGYPAIGQPTVHGTLERAGGRAPPLPVSCKPAGPRPPRRRQARERSPYPATGRSSISPPAAARKATTGTTCGTQGLRNHTSGTSRTARAGEPHRRKRSSKKVG